MYTWSQGWSTKAKSVDRALSCILGVTKRDVFWGLPNMYPESYDCGLPGHLAVMRAAMISLPHKPKLGSQNHLPRNGNLTHLPKFGSLPHLPESGSPPHLPQFGSLPHLPKFDSLPHLPKFGSLPYLPKFGSLPHLPKFGSLPHLPKFGSLLHLIQSIPTTWGWHHGNLLQARTPIEWRNPKPPEKVEHKTKPNQAQPDKNEDILTLGNTHQKPMLMEKEENSLESPPTENKRKKT